jgi:hypothetical protein
MNPLGIAALFFWAGVAGAQPAHLENARLEVREAGADAAATFASVLAAQREPAWIGYSVPGAAGRTMCCFEFFEGEPRGGGGCRLEHEGSYGNSRRKGAVPLEDAAHIVVLVRASAGRIEKVRTFSTDCALDAGGRSVIWLSGLDEAQSVRILAPLAAKDVRKVSEGAMHALSAHAGRPSVDTLISLAKTHATSRTRGHALFWLAQRAGEEARSAITSALENDPETDVKKKAVFALSQLPQDEGVPLLIRTARQNRNPEVRRQAMFWLGQSQDTRAVAFFEEILTR